MRQIRVRFKIATSLGTPLQADTIFGHLCWAIRYLEGEAFLRDLLNSYDSVTPLLVSDGFPAVEDRFYLAKPMLPIKPAQANLLARNLEIDESDRVTYRKFSSALKSLERTGFVEASVLSEHAINLSAIMFYEDCFALCVCPRSMAARRIDLCDCESCLDCPGLETGSEHSRVCPEKGPTTTKSLTMHNTVDRITNSASNLFAEEVIFPDHWLYFLANFDDSLLTEDLLKRCVEYLAHAGFGRGASTGSGAIEAWDCTEAEKIEIEDANAFVNLSPAYVPRAGELKDNSAWYALYVKRGKLGGDYVLTHSPWKQPMVMLRAGSVIRANPSTPHGCLVRNVHRQLPQVVQYGYAFPFGVRLDEEAL